VEHVPNSTITRVASVADIDALPTDTFRVLVAELDDRKLCALRRLNAVWVLYHEGESRVTDEGLTYLVTFPELECLDLHGSTAITDRGLMELRLLRALRWLDLRSCRQLTGAGVAALRMTLPRCEIIA
jgi:hypothetical protein